MDVNMASSWTAACDTDQAAVSVLRHASHASDVTATVDDDYFDSTRELDESQFDDLLNSFVPDTKSQQLSPDQSSDVEVPKALPPPVPSIEAGMNSISPASSSSNTSAMQYNGLPVNDPMSYGPTTTVRGGLPPSAFQHHDTAHYTAPMNYYSRPYVGNPLYLPPAPPAPPPTAIPSGYYVDPPIQYTNYSTPYYTPSREGTEDLLDDANMIPEGDDDDAAEAADPCYAQLLYRCLRDAPDHTLTLKNLYEWVQQNSKKARDSSSKGWQNSVRHNLSMNAAFERVTLANANSSVVPKKGSLWRLTASALANGVISTTRYRKDPKRKPERRSSPALKRQISGAKGGQATRAASAHRKAVLARTNARASNIGYNMLNNLDRHRQQAMRHDYPPTSMPTPASASASPAFFPQHMTSAGHASGPPSPYFTQQSPQWTHVLPTNFSNPNTPEQMQANAFGDHAKGLLNEFELAAYPHKFNFGDDDHMESPLTDSEANFFPDEKSIGMGMDRKSVYT